MKYHTHHPTHTHHTQDYISVSNHTPHHTHTHTHTDINDTYCIFTFNGKQPHTTHTDKHSSEAPISALLIGI